MTKARPAPRRRPRPQARPAREARPRRGRVLLVAAALFAGAVLLTGIPVSALLTQHRQLAATSAQLAQLRSANQALGAQAKGLSDPATAAGIARSEYGLVPAGQKAFVILPPPGASPDVVAGSGHVPLDGPPVVPGSARSRELLGLGSVPTTTDPPATGSGPRAPGSASSSGGFWARVLHTLEFWR